MVNEILLATAGGKSPVEGESFPTLSSQYADKEKGGNRNPNLRLDGDLMQDLSFEDGGVDSIKVGHFGGDEMGKADGHNKWNLSNNTAIPKRRYIPKGAQKFSGRIESGINQIIKENSVQPTLDFRTTKTGRPRTSETIHESTQVQLTDLTSDNGLDLFLQDFLNGQN